MVQPPFDFWEHRSKRFDRCVFSDGRLPVSRKFGTDIKRYVYEVVPSEDHYLIRAGYFVGVDWLVEGEFSMMVSPKLDDRLPADVDEFEFTTSEIGLETENPPAAIDYMSMLRICLSDNILYNEIDRLVHIDWKAKEINIQHANDLLSPLLVVKYLQLLRSLVRKGLKKSYYTVVNNSGRVKGKILVGANTSANVFRNRLTKTVCRFEEFGLDSSENRLLKKAMFFAQNYLENHAKLVGQDSAYFSDLISFCRPSFEQIGDDLQIDEVKYQKTNPFFTEYTEALALARVLLKRFGYTISRTSGEIFATPPFWIDMPRLFELYVYHLLKCRFLGGVKELSYHFRTHGNELDFLINCGDIKMVVDAKYKPYYKFGTDHQDMRQVAGYARLEKTYRQMGISDDNLITCLIIYPDIQNGLTMEEFLTADLKTKAVRGYRKIFKIGVKLPVKSWPGQ